MQKIKKFSYDERGAASVEFVVLFPFAFGLMALNFDAALLMLKYTNLESALDKTIREVRLHGFPSTENGVSNADYFKSEICKHAGLFNSCNAHIAVEMTPIDTSTGFVKPTDVKCIDRTEENQPVIEFTPGRQNDAVYLRACVVVDRYFPNTLPGLFTTDASGGIQLVADTAYVVEPL